MTRQMVAKAVLTEALAVWCKLKLPRAMMVVMKRTEAVESKKTATRILMKTVAAIFPWLAGSLRQLVMDLCSLGYP